MSNLWLRAMVCGVGLLAAVSVAGAGGYDSNGFEAPTFALGLLNGQDGWQGGSGGGGVDPIVVTIPDPVIGLQAVRLEVPDAKGANSEMKLNTANAYGPNCVVTVSFDIFRDHQVQNLWWWWIDVGDPTYGLQWDLSQATYPFGWYDGAGQTPTIFGRYVNLTMEWNFPTGVATAWYDGNLVTQVPIQNINSLTSWSIYLAHDAATGTGGDVVWIDNFKSSVVPEPAAMSVIGLGLAGVLFRLRRR